MTTPAQVCARLTRDCSTVTAAGASILVERVSRSLSCSACSNSPTGISALRMLPVTKEAIRPVAATIPSGLATPFWPLAWRAHDQDPRAHRPALPSACLPADGRAGRRLHGRDAAPGAAAFLSRPARRQGLRHQRDPSSGRGERGGSQHPLQDHSTLEGVLLAHSLPWPQRHRAHVLPPQGLPSRGHPLRPARNKLSRRRLPRCHRQLLVMSLSPKRQMSRKMG